MYGKVLDFIPFYHYFIKFNNNKKKLNNLKIQEPGKAEEEFATVDIREFFKNVMSNTDPRAPYLPGEVKFEGVPPPPLAPWLTPEDIDVYADKFTHTGFTGGLNYYRAFDR
ncbi:MAG: hypothetical protein Q8754_02590 [Sweet potato little leaf phytoplasma]|nr:hypothetical protein [Sweet potato little leaf phytoplasma]